MDFEGEVNSQLGFPPISTRSRAMSADLIEFFKDLGLSERGPRNCQWPTYRHHGTRRYLFADAVFVHGGTISRP